MKAYVLGLWIFIIAVCSSCLQKGNAKQELADQNRHTTEQLSQDPEESTEEEEEPKEESVVSIMTREHTSHFNLENIKIYKGEIVHVQTVHNPHTQSNWVWLMVQTDKGEIPVELGPILFVWGGPVDLVPGTKLSVKGAEMYFEGRIFMMAQELKVDGYKLLLRDKDGLPYWTGWIK